MNKLSYEMVVEVKGPNGRIFCTSMPEDVPDEWTVEDSVEKQNILDIVANMGPLSIPLNKSEVQIIPPQLVQQCFITITKRPKKIVKQTIDIGLKTVQ